MEIPDYEEPVPCFIALLEALRKDRRTSGRSLRVFGLLFDPERRSIARVAAYLLGRYDTRTHRWENEPNPAYSLAQLSALASHKQRRAQVQSWNYPMA